MIIISNWTKLPEGCCDCPFVGDYFECLASINTIDDYDDVKYVKAYINYEKYRNERAPFCPLKEETK